MRVRRTSHPQVTLKRGRGRKRRGGRKKEKERKEGREKTSTFRFGIDPGAVDLFRESLNKKRSFYFRKKQVGKETQERCL